MTIVCWMTALFSSSFVVTCIFPGCISPKLSRKALLIISYAAVDNVNTMLPPAFCSTVHVSLSVALFFFLIAFSLFNEKGIAILFVTIVLLVAFVRDMIAVFRVAGEYVIGGCRVLAERLVYIVKVLSANESASLTGLLVF